MKNLLLARLFAEFQDVLPEASISKKSAEKILNALYAMNLSVEQLSWAISKIRCLKHDQMMAGLVDTATDADIKAVVNSIFEQIMLQRENSSTPDMAYAHNTEITAWMFEEIKKTKKKLKEGDQVNIQIMRVGKWKHPTYGEVRSRRIRWIMCSGTSKRTRGELIWPWMITTRICIVPWAGSGMFSNKGRTLYLRLSN